MKTPDAIQERFFTFPQTGETVKLSIQNSVKHFRWKLSIGDYSTNWTGHYSGLCVIASRVNPSVQYMYATDYWLGTLPTEQVLMVARADCLTAQCTASPSTSITKSKCATLNNGAWPSCANNQAQPRAGHQDHE